MRLPDAEARRRLAAADHAVLATLHPARGADLVPVCFALRADLVAVPIDEVKPKGAAELGRQANLRDDPRAALLAERWDRDDWSRLWWVRASLAAADPGESERHDLERALRARYRQYAEAQFRGLLVFRVVAVVGWAASDAPA